MSEEIRHRALLTAVLVCLMAAVLSFGCGDSPSDKPASGTSSKPTPAAQAKPAVEPLDLALFISPGAQPGQMVALVRLYSQLARQEVLDSRRRPKGKGRVTGPHTLPGGPELWTKKLVFVVQPPGGGKTIELSPAPGGPCQAIRYPKAEKPSLDHERSYPALYRLNEPGQIVPGAMISAVLKLKDRSIRSPALVVPGPAADAKQAALRKARNARWLGDEKALLAASADLIKLEPGSMAGYWYQGLALENMGQNQQALASYVKAWKMWLQSRKDPNTAEPPVRLLRRMAALKSKTGQSAAR